MKPFLIAIILILTNVALTGQDFSLHSENPFNLELLPSEEGYTPFKMEFFDFDADGDKDFFKYSLSLDSTGKLNVFHMIYLIEMQENIGTAADPSFAPVTVVQDFEYPKGLFTPVSGDLDADGMRDIVSCGAIQPISSVQPLTIYMGQDSGGFLMLPGDSFGLASMPPRSLMFPELTDLDMDGDLDILVSGSATLPGDKYSYERVVHYARNYGTPTEPLFHGWFRNPFGLKQDTISESMISGDIDNDGDTDILSIARVGEQTPVYVLENEQNGAPSFLPRVESPYGLPQASMGITFLTPALTDIDDDGDLDLFIIYIEEDYGALQFYENDLCAAVTTDVNATICVGDTFSIGDQMFTEDGNYSIELEAANGCDSIVNLALEILDSVWVAMEVEACDGESLIIAGQEITVPGIYEILLTGSNGCDSTLIVTATAFPNYDIPISAEICEGESYIIAGVEYDQSGTYDIWLTSSDGCDSVIRLDLQVHPASHTELTEDLCIGDVFTIGSEDITESGSYHVVLTNALGCDSVIDATLTFHEIDTSVSLSEGTLTASIDGATYQWIDCASGLDIDGATDQSFVPESSGIYAVRITNDFGCEATSECIEVIVSSTSEPDWGREIILYPNPASDRVFIDNKSPFAITEVLAYTSSGLIETVPVEGLEHGIDLSDFPPGVVLIGITVHEELIIRKLVLTGSN